MKRLLLMSMMLLFAVCGQSQTPFVDTLYSIQTTTDIVYGSAVDFAGNVRELEMDVSVPVGDVDRPSCGRPLMVLVHGGAFMMGSKEGENMPRMRKDFAKRGYVTAAVNYRLGMFQTNLPRNCNITPLLGIEWNCLNMADTTEWLRAYYRGIQDVKGAVRYLVDHAADYQIDTANIYVVGESAGAFIAMGVGFLDHPSEVVPGQMGDLGTVLAPNALYDMGCVQKYGWDTSLASMDLRRPDLGDFKGELHNPASQNFHIRGVGDFYGGVFNSIFHGHYNKPPALYIFHQPNDLLVPYNTNKILAKYAECGTFVNCAWIMNCPLVSGGYGIREMLEDMKADGDTINYVFENTQNGAECLDQLLNPGLQGHRIDNYWLRTTNMATLFASVMDTCALVSVSHPTPEVTLKLYPNPAAPGATVVLEGMPRGAYRIDLFDAQGRMLMQRSEARLDGRCEMQLPELPEGLYYLRLYGASLQLTKHLLIRR